MCDVLEDREGTRAARPARTDASPLDHILARFGVPAAALTPVSPNSAATADTADVDFLKAGDSDPDEAHDSGTFGPAAPAVPQSASAHAP